mmetsp:Transcript_11527/g.32689  ORF Transcript_11527/g.32689 Transcript_11527/m.32689 type:complete len:287 (-) Transcript_11527:422-1282(-)
MELEAKYPGYILIHWLWGSKHRVGHHQQVWEGRAKVGAVDVAVVLGPRVVDVLTLGAVHLDGAAARYVRVPHRQAGLPIAVYSGTPPKVQVLVLLKHGTQPTRGQYVAHVDEAIQKLSCTLDHLMLLLRQDLVRGGVHIQDQVQRVLIVGHLHAEPTEVEVILHVVVVHLAEELVALEAAEPGYPAGVLIGPAPVAILVALLVRHEQLFGVLAAVASSPKPLSATRPPTPAAGRAHHLSRPRGPVWQDFSPAWPDKLLSWQKGPPVPDRSCRPALPQPASRLPDHW